MSTENKTIIKNYIVGGTPTTAHPAIGFLQIKTQSGVVSRCTGTLIAPDLFLTAAHCALSRANEGRIAEVLLYKQDGTRVHIPVSNCYVHSVYDLSNKARGSRADIAVFKLLFSAPEDIKPIPIHAYAPVGIPEIPNRIEIYGYGVHDAAKRQGDPQKRKAVLPVIKATRRRIYLGQGENGQNACFGDSGGPAIVYDAKGNPSVVGVMSAVGDHCSKLTVLTSVPFHAQIIADAVGGIDSQRGRISHRQDTKKDAASERLIMIDALAAPNSEFRKYGVGIIQTAELTKLPQNPNLAFQVFLVASACAVLYLGVSYDANRRN